MAKEKTDTLIAPQEQTTPIVTFPVQPEVKEQPANIILKLKGAGGKGAVMLYGQDFVYDPETKTQRRMRLLTNVSTVWEDEQEFAKIDKKWADNNVRSLEFTAFGSACFLQPHDFAAIKFAELTNSNWDNPHRIGVKQFYFEIHNPLKDAQDAEAAEYLSMAAMEKAMQIKSTDQTKMKAHAAYLGIPMTGVYGEVYPAEKIGIEYFKFAKNKPAKFMETVNKPEVDFAWAIRNLIVSGKIDMTTYPGQAVWHEGGFIAQLTSDKDTITSLVEFALMKSEESKTFLQQVKELSNIS